MILVCYLGLHVQLSLKTPRSLNSSATSLSSLDASSPQVVSLQSPPSPRGIKPFGKMRCQCSTAFRLLFVANMNNIQLFPEGKVNSGGICYVVYVIESAAYGVICTSCLCQKPEQARYERVRAFDTNSKCI